jgi:hypothetical protein
VHHLRNEGHAFLERPGSQERRVLGGEPLCHAFENEPALLLTRQAVQFPALQAANLANQQFDQPVGPLWEGCGVGLGGQPEYVMRPATGAGAWSVTRPSRLSRVRCCRRSSGLASTRGKLSHRMSASFSSVRALVLVLAVKQGEPFRAC